MINTPNPIQILLVGLTFALNFSPAAETVLINPVQTKKGTGRSASTKGSLLICGGGSLPSVVKKKFVELAGGKKAILVVIPTASERLDNQSLVERKQYWIEAGIGKATILHTRSRKEADSDKFVEPLKSATAVWFSGGQQSLLAEAYQGTATEKAILGLIERGGIVGGTSAGAAIQTQVMIQSGNPVPVVAKGMDLLPRAIVDQHFLRRNRFNRLLTAVNQHPNRIGVGISESTAVLYKDDLCEVLGRSFVIVVRAKQDSRPLSIESFRAGQKFQLPIPQSRNREE